MKKIFKGHSPWGFLSFRHSENQEPPRYLTGYMPVKRIHKAASVGDIPQVQKMLEFGDIDVNITDRKKRTALHYACAHGQSEMVSLLLWYDCNIEARDREESTPLIKATQRQHEICVKILLENGADSNAVDIHQNTSLHYTVYNNDTTIAAKLLAFNADTEIKTKNGYTPLILAVLENKQEMVELLLQAAANINALDNCKRSALIHAVRTQSKNMTSLLLQQGANESLVDIYGATAQSYAVFETFQVLSQGPGPRSELTTKEARHNFDTKDGLIPCSHSIKEDNKRMEENTDAVDELGSQTASKHEENELESCADGNSEVDACPECYSKTSFAHRPSNSEPIEVEDDPSLSTKPPVIQSPMLTESSLWAGYPADWPEPIKFSRQPAVYNPTEWREDMESRSVPLESKQQVAVLPGKKAKGQTLELQSSRAVTEPGASSPDLPSGEDAKDELVSLLASLEKKKPQMKEFPVTEAAKCQTDVKLQRQGVLEFEEKGLEICQDSNLEAAESTESYSILRFTKPDVSDPEPTSRKDEYKFDTKDEDGLERHLLAPRASQHQAKPTSPPPVQLQERSREPEMGMASDEEDTSGLSKSAKGQILEGKLTLGEIPEGKETVQCVINKPTQKGDAIYKDVNASVYLKEERPPDVSGKAHLTSAPTTLTYNTLDCGDRDVSAALVSEALRTSPRQEEGGLGNAFPSPSSSQDVDYSGQSLTKFPLMRNKLDCENNTSELEESFHKRREKSSKNIESRKVKGKCPEVRMGEKQGGHEFKSQSQKTVKPKRTDWQLDIGHMLKSSDDNRKQQERSHVSEVKSWGDSTLVSDMNRKSKGTQDLFLKPLPCKGHCEAPARAVGTASDAPPGGQTTRAFANEELRDRLSDSEFRILEEEILAWERVHLENESVSENLLNKCEGIISDATDQQGQYLDMDQVAEVDSEGTSQLEQKNLDSSENTQLSDPDLSKMCPQTQSTPADPTTLSQPLSEKEGKQTQPPSLHLKKMSEDLEINKKYDKECAPGHPEVPSVKVHGREPLTGDTTGKNRGSNKSSSELQHTAGDVLENICPAEDPDDCRRTHFKVEEISKKQGSLKLEVSELSPAEEKDELAKCVPDSCIKEAKDSEKEAWSPREPVVTPESERPPPEGAGLLLLKDGRLLTKMDQAERRLTKREAKEKHKTKTQVNEMEEASHGSEPRAPASGWGSGSPLKLCDTTHSDERLIELKNRHCELLTRKPGKMGTMREQTEITKIKTWSQHKEGAWDKLCALRFPLKQDEKQENAEFMFQQKKPQLQREKEQCGGSVQWTQYSEIGTVIAELKALEKDLRQLQEAQDQLTQTVQSSKKIRAILQRLEVRLSKLKITLKEQSAKIEQIQNHLLQEGLLEDETEKLIHQTQSLEHTLEKQMNKDEELLAELTRFKKLFEETRKKLNKHEGGELGGPGDLKSSLFDMHIPINMLRHEFHNLKESWETTYYKYLHMVVKLQFIEQELIAIKTEQKKCGHLLKNQKNLEEEVLHLKSWIRESEIQARDQNNIENLRDTNDAAMISQIDLRIKNMETQLAMRGTQQHLPGGGMPKHKHHHAEEGSLAQPVRTEPGCRPHS